MKIAYIISAYKLPDQLVRLVKKLDTDNNSFFIHVDKKTDDGIFNQMSNPLKGYDNVRFIRRYPCYWGRIGHVQATIEGLKNIYRSSVEHDFVILLTGQDYPIKSNCFIENFLQENKGYSFINYSPIPDPKDNSAGENWLEPISYWHLYWMGRHFVFPRKDMFDRANINKVWNVFSKTLKLRRKLPYSLRPFHGGSYWCLSNDCAKYFYDYVQCKKKYLDFFKYSLFPDEIFFQTILLNSIFKDQLINDDLRYIKFSGKLAHPHILGTADFEKFMNSSDLFARKFDATIDEEVLDMIDKVI